MRKDEILNKSWMLYLHWWVENVKDESKPPTEDGFWVWYASNNLNPTTLTTEDINM